MFYFGVFDIFFSLITTAIPLDIVAQYGYRSSAMVYFLWSTLLIILGSALVYKEMTKPHKVSSLSRGVGFIFVFIALMLSAGLDDTINPSDLNIIASFLIPGLLIYSYNKPAKKQRPAIKQEPKKEIQAPKPETKTIQIAELSKIDLLILKLKSMQYTMHAKNNEEFINNLNASVLLLVELQRNEYMINTYLINQMLRLTDIYFNLDNKLILTPKSEELIKKVMDSFEMISISLLAMYDRSFEEEALQIESEIKTLELKLKAEGLMPSEFTME